MTDPQPDRSPAARRRRIVSTLHAVGFASITDLARQLGTSDMTIRRDLRKLAELDTVRVVRGGVSLPHGPLHTGDFAARIRTQADAKRRIASHAMSLVSSRDAVAIDAGTTTYALAEALPDTFDGTVVTHSIPVIALMLSRGASSVVGLGGDLRYESQAFVGPMTVDAISRLRVRTLFLGAVAIDHRGVYVAEDVERPAKHALMDIADQVVLLADRTKFATSAPIQLCPLERIAILVTDEAPPAMIAQVLSRANVGVMTASDTSSRRA